jgi:hypothetical protein
MHHLVNLYNLNITSQGEGSILIKVRVSPIGQLGSDITSEELNLGIFQPPQFTWRNKRKATAALLQPKFVHHYRYRQHGRARNVVSSEPSSAITDVDSNVVFNASGRISNKYLSFTSLD